MSEHFFGQLLDTLFMTSVIWAPMGLLSFLSHKMCVHLGRKTVLTLGFIGVPIHEVSHAAVCVICSHKITDISLYSPSSDGTLGYVNHQYRKTWLSPYCLFLIGLAPILGGWASFGFLTYYLRPDILVVFQTHIGEVGNLSDATKFLFHIVELAFGRGGWMQTIVWAIVGFSILLFSIPSKADFRGCKSAVFVVGALYMLWVAISPNSAGRALEASIPILTVVSAPLYLTIILLIPVFILVKFVRIVSKKHV